MKKIILSIMLVLLTSSNLFAGKDNFYNETIKQVSKYQRRDIRPYLNSSYHVAKMFKQFPHDDFHQRVSICIGFGSQESEFRPNYVHYNIPGKPYPGLNGLKVKRFSVDFGWSGLNEDNVNITYLVAKAIQSGKNISRGQLLRLGLHPDLMVEIKKRLVIPKKMELFKIDVSTAIEARRQYDNQVRSGIPPKQIKISIPYSEDTVDKIDSVLLYRTIVEFDRHLRGWPLGRYDNNAYNICQKIIND